MGQHHSRSPHGVSRSQATLTRLGIGLVGLVRIIAPLAASRLKTRRPTTSLLIWSGGSWSELTIEAQPASASLGDQDGAEALEDGVESLARGMLLGGRN